MLVNDVHGISAGYPWMRAASQAATLPRPAARRRLCELGHGRGCVAQLHPYRWKPARHPRSDLWISPDRSGRRSVLIRRPTQTTRERVAPREVAGVFAPPMPLHLSEKTIGTILGSVFGRQAQSAALQRSIDQWASLAAAAAKGPPIGDPSPRCQRCDAGEGSRSTCREAAGIITPAASAICPAAMTPGSPPRRMWLAPLR